MSYSRLVKKYLMEIKNRVDEMQHDGVAIYSKNTIVNSKGGVHVITWQECNSSILQLPISKINTYDMWLKNGQYNVMFIDGSLLQLSVFINGDKMVAHRYAYIQCPYELESDMLRTMSVDEILDYYETISRKEVRLGSHLRFDFDLNSTGDRHATVHTTINVPECRIPVKRPLSPTEFIRLILKDMYDYRHLTFEALRSIGKSSEALTISTSERTEFHIDIYQEEDET